MGGISEIGHKEKVGCNLCSFKISQLFSVYPIGNCSPMGCAQLEITDLNKIHVVINCWFSSFTKHKTNNLQQSWWMIEAEGCSWHAHVCSWESCYILLCSSALLANIDCNVASSMFSVITVLRNYTSFSSSAAAFFLSLEIKNNFLCLIDI